MRQLTFLAPGTLEWRDVPEPTLQGPGEAIVAPLAIATCDLDAAMLRGLVTQHCKRLQREQQWLRPWEEAGPC